MDGCNEGEKLMLFASTCLVIVSIIACLISYEFNKKRD